MPVGSDDADACVLDDMTGFVVALWLPGCASADAIAAEPLGAALSRLVVERLLRAREPMTAIPAKPPVAVTLRTSERRRWEWRLRWRPAVPAVEPPCATNSDSVEVVLPRGTERARGGTATDSCRPTAGWRIRTPEGDACA
jgi:hypothetical protein